MEDLVKAQTLSQVLKSDGTGGGALARGWCGTYKVLQSWFVGVSAKMKNQGRWARGSGKGGSTAELGTIVHNELAVAHGVPGQKLHPMTVAVIAALEKRGLVIVCGDTLVTSSKRDVATGVDLIATRDPTQTPLRVVLIEIKTGGVGGAGKRLGSGKRHACPPMDAIPQTLQGFAHAQLAATSFLFDCCRPAGAIATGALVVSVTPGTRANKIPQVHIVECLAPFMKPEHLETPMRAWKDVLLVGRALVEGRASSVLKEGPHRDCDTIALYEEVKRLPWKPSPKEVFLGSMLGHGSGPAGVS
jgi:hypothetical protein